MGTPLGGDTLGVHVYRRSELRSLWPLLSTHFTGQSVTGVRDNIGAMIGPWNSFRVVRAHHAGAGLGVRRHIGRTFSSRTQGLQHREREVTECELLLYDIQ